MPDEQSDDVKPVEKTVDVYFVQEKITLKKVKVSISKTRVMIHAPGTELTRPKKLQSIHIIETNQTTKFSGLYNVNEKTKKVNVFVTSNFNVEDTTPEE